MASVREHVIETAALGRPLQLGMLYDCRNDSIVPGITLWDQKQLQHNTNVRSQHNTEFTVATSDTIEEKSKQMKVDGELKLSLMCGNVNVSGAARYFNDTKKSFIQQRMTLHYKTTTRFEQLTMEHLAQGQIHHHELFHHDIATHVVTAVLYGADAYFVFDKEKNVSDETKDVQGDVKIAADKLKFLCFTGAQVELNMNENEKTTVKQMKCTFYGDFKLSSNPTTFEDAVKVYHDLPKMLGDNGEHAVPVKVWLYPLDKLDSSAAKLQRNISTDLIRAVESVIEDLNVTSMRCGDLMEDTVAKTFGTFHNRVQDFLKFCTEYKQDFMIKLQSILPKIRGGKTDIKDLSELLEAHEKSPFRSRDVLQWITMKEKKSNQIKSLLKQLKEPEAEVDADRDKCLLDLNVENLVSYTFTCLQHPEPLLTQQENYLKPSTVTKPSENTLSLDLQEKSWTLEELMCMRNNLQIFKDLIILNKSNKKTRFIVESVPQTPDKPGSCVLIYENGGSDVTCFVPPSKPKPPTVENVTDNSIKLKMSSLCAATLKMQLLHKTTQENSWKSQTVTDESVTLTNLEEGTDYEIKCAAVGKMDYKVESDVTVTTICSVIKRHGAKSHQVPAQDHTANQTMKYFTVTLGCTLKHHLGIEQKFQEIIPALQNVQNPEDCDFIMAFCPVVAIEAAEKTLNSLTGNKPAVLVVLHHPEHIVKDSSRSVNRQNTITVYCVIHEDQRLLPCSENDKALSKVIEFIEDIQGGTPSKSPYDQPSGYQMLKHPRLTYFTLMSGNTLGHHVEIERKLQEQIPGLQKGMKLEESDLVLVFCPVVSRAGTDTEAAVEMLNTQAGDKPAVLVVLHHTFNAEHIVPDSSRSVNRHNTFTADCLFHNDQGLLMCHKNNEALSKVVNWIKIIQGKTTRKSPNHQPSGNQMLNNTEIIVPDSSRSVNRQNTITTDRPLNEDQRSLPCHKNNEALSKDVNFTEGKASRKSKNHQPSGNQMLKRPRLTYFTLMSGKTLGHHVDIEKKLQELIPGLQKVELEDSDFILIFCPVVSQAGTDIVEALKMLNTQAGDKRAVLVVLHHTFNPELIVPDSSRSVNRQNTITVDCLFYEDQGLLMCHKNNEAMSKVVNWLNPKGDENPEKNTFGNFREYIKFVINLS